jgi:phage terminase large subunit-like protein
MPDGSKWTVRAAKPSVGHGTSNDLIVADEIFDISAPSHLTAALIPSMRARKSPLLLSCWSTAGTEASTAFLRWREQGLRAIDKGEQTSLYFAEWSPPPDIDPMTPAAWAYGNPALGHTLEMSTIESESAKP